MSFLDKLENLLITSDNIAYVLLPAEEDMSGDKDTLYIGAGSVAENNMKITYVKEIINYLTLPKEDCLYSVIVSFFSKEKNNLCLIEEILKLQPTDDDLLFLYQHIQLQEEEIPSFLQLLKDKQSFIDALKMGNIRSFYIENEKEFLKKCFDIGKNFELSVEDYYDIFASYIKNSRMIVKKDRLFELFIDYVDNSQLLENLFEKIYRTKINIAHGITTKTVEKIDMNSLSLMKNYKFIGSDDIDKLLDFFVTTVRNNIDSFTSTINIEYFKSVKNFSNFTEYSLIVETSNINECCVVLDLYLKHYVSFNTNSSQFIENLKHNPQIFDNFILYKKLDDKLTNKNSKNIMKKI